MCAGVIVRLGDGARPRSVRGPGLQVDPCVLFPLYSPISPVGVGQTALVTDVIIEAEET